MKPEEENLKLRCEIANEKKQPIQITSEDLTFLNEANSDVFIDAIKAGNKKGFYKRMVLSNLHRPNQARSVRRML